MVPSTDYLLRGILATQGRLAFPPLELHRIINPTGKAIKNIEAYNLANSTRSQAEICALAKVDSSNFSKMVARWISAGVMFRLGDERDAPLLHLYRLDEDSVKE